MLSDNGTKFTPFNLDKLRLSRTAWWMVILVITGFLLVYFKRFFQPLVMAMLLWFIMKELREFLARIKIRGKSFPYWLRNLLSFLIIVGFVFLVVDIIRLNFIKLGTNYEVYAENTSYLVDDLEERFNAPTLGQDIDARLADINYDTIIGSTINSITTFLGDFILVIIYLAFLLLEEVVTPQKKKLIFENLGGSGESSQELLDKIGNSISKYLSVKVFTSFITGFLSFIVLRIIGIELAGLWAFLIFLLNFIPSIGSMIATLFPSLFSIVQYGEFSTFLVVFIAIGAIQLLVGNVIEPNIMGDTLNISPLVIIVGLAFWGALWGIIGMLLSAPITAIMIIILSQFPTTKNLAILMSHKGNVSVELDDIAPRRKSFLKRIKL